MVIVSPTFKFSGIEFDVMRIFMNIAKGSKSAGYTTAVRVAMIIEEIHV
ncbi:MAG: hypothetical protein QW612_03925 [Candidatus Bathyarchaeia archaeon]